jgi:hypothetical protein
VCEPAFASISKIFWTHEHKSQQKFELSGECDVEEPSYSPSSSIWTWSFAIIAARQPTRTFWFDAIHSSIINNKKKIAHIKETENALFYNGLF